QAHDHGHHMLLELEGSHGPPPARLLHRNSHVGAVLDVDPRAQQEGGDIEDEDHERIGRSRSRAQTLDEFARGLAHRYHHGDCLQRDGREQADRHQEMEEEQDPPERPDRDDLENEVNGAASLCPRPATLHRRGGQLSNELSQLTISNILEETRSDTTSFEPGRKTCKHSQLDGMAPSLAAGGLYSQDAMGLYD